MFQKPLKRFLHNVIHRRSGPSPGYVPAADEQLAGGVFRQAGAIVLDEECPGGLGPALGQAIDQAADLVGPIGSADELPMGTFVGTPGHSHIGRGIERAVPGDENIVDENASKDY